MLEIIDGYESFLRLREPWNELAGRFENPFIRHECAVACAEAFCKRDKVAVIVCRSGTNISAVVPFRVARRGGVTRWEMLDRVIGEPTGFLFSDVAALNRLVDGLLAHRKPLMLGRLADDGPEMRTLSDKLRRGRGWGATRRQDSSLWVPLYADSSQLEANMASGRRSYIRRKMRRAEKLGGVEFEAFAPDETTLDPLLRQAYRVEAAGWKGRNGTAIILKPDAELFFTEYCRAAARLGILRLYFLRIGGEVAAMRIAVENAGRIWEVKIGYDERFHDCSPGVLLTHETLKFCCGKDVSAFEFLGFTEPWESAWASRERQYSSLNLHPPSLTGCMSLSQDACWRIAKTTLRTLGLDKEARKERSRRASAAAAATARRGSDPADGAPPPN